MCFPVIKRISSHHRSWTQINTVSLACPITKDYSSTDGREGISVSVTFLVSSLVIVPKPNQMRIWLRLRLITNRGGQQAICSAVLLIICEDRHTQSIPTADEKWICCLIRCTSLLGVFDQQSTFISSPNWNNSIEVAALLYLCYQQLYSSVPHLINTFETSQERTVKCFY